MIEINVFLRRYKVNKNIKKLLSYLLCLVLAIGLGVGYAYAVGANDTNAFVTKQEWEEKVAQVRASIDNINKTIKDTNMDYVMHGPRIQVSFVDGFTSTSPITTDGTLAFANPFSYYNATNIYNLYSLYNNVVLLDQWNGHQAIGNFYWHTSDLSSSQVNCSCRFAVKTIDPNVYLVVSVYDGSSSYVYGALLTYVVLGDLTEYPYASARTIQVSLPLSEWWTLRGTAGPTTRSGTDSTTGVYYSTGGSNKFPSAIQRGNNTYDGGWSSGGSITCSVGVSEVSYSINFPAGAHTIKQANTSSPYCIWDVFPMNMKDRRYGGIYDTVYIPSSATDLYSPVVKVYSPQKGCLALKNRLNGEIPILNEN